MHRPLGGPFYTAEAQRQLRRTAEARKRANSAPQDLDTLLIGPLARDHASASYIIVIRPVVELRRSQRRLLLEFNQP
jgi:hypothetical protein